MTTRVSSADLEKDKETINAVIRRSLNPDTTHSRYDWIYRDNPYGKGRIWLAYSEGDVIGIGAAFPRLFRVAEKTAPVWVLGDFCLDSRSRSLGPALQLQRACLSVLENGDDTFCYDFPSASMVAVYKRLGFNVAGQMLRLAKPLRVDRKVKERIQNPVAQWMASSVGNTFLKFASMRVRPDQRLEISIQQGFCGEEFTTLAEPQRGKFAFCLLRTAEYLNWRYLNNPLARHEIVTARRDGRLVGYIAWTQNAGDASIADLFGEEDRQMVRSLVAKIMVLARERGVETLSVSMNESHPWLSLFSEMGFRRRESAPIIIIPSKGFKDRIDSKLTGWYLMQGDRDC